MKLNNNDDSHNSGLNLLIYNMLLDIESHPTWVCGLKLVKGRIEGSVEGKAILEQQLSFVRRTSKIAKEETARRDALFREYVTEHGDMTWQEFIDWKNGKPQQKDKK